MSDVEGLRLVLRSFLGDRYRVTVTEDGECRGVVEALVDGWRRLWATIWPPSGGFQKPLARRIGLVQCLESLLTNGNGLSLRPLLLEPSRSNELVWEARYTATDGRRRSLYARTKREATDRLREALGQAQSGILPVSRRLLTGDYLDAWLETLTVRERTAESYRGIVHRYLKPAIGRVPLAKLQPEHVIVMLRDLEQHDPPLSPTTIRYVYVVLRIALGRALKLGHVQRNIATLIDPPAKDRRERQPMSAEQARTFLASVQSDRLEALYRLAIASG